MRRNGTLVRSPSVAPKGVINCKAKNDDITKEEVGSTTLTKGSRLRPLVLRFISSTSPPARGDIVLAENA